MSAPASKNSSKTPGSRRAADRRKLVAIVLGVAVVLAVALILLAPSGKDEAAPEGAAQVSGRALAEQEFGGIEQQGAYLGDPKAPYELVEYSDLQCPACKVWSDGVVPSVVNDLVRSGQVRFALRPVGILGEDSVAGANYAWAAARQNRLHEFVKVWYLNQGQENSGYVSEAFARNIASAVPGLNADQLIADSKDPDVIAQADKAGTAFVDRGFDSVPTFTFGPAGGKQTELQLGDGDGASAVAALRAEMGN